MEHTFVICAYGDSPFLAVDWDAWERLMKRHGKVKFMPKQLMVHRIHEDSETTANTENQNREVEEFMMYQRYWPKPVVKLLMKAYVKNQKANDKP